MALLRPPGGAVSPYIQVNEALVRIPSDAPLAECFNVFSMERYGVYTVSGRYHDICSLAKKVLTLWTSTLGLVVLLTTTG